MARSGLRYQPVADPVSARLGAGLLVGILNTVRVFALAVVLATIIGTMVAMDAVVETPLSRLMMVYVEILRNVPLLLLLFLCYAVIVSSLPPVRNALQILPSFYFSNGGLMVSWWNRLDELSWITCADLGAIAATFLAKAMRARRVATGVERKAWPFVALTFIGPAVLLALVLSPHPLGRFSEMSSL